MYRIVEKCVCAGEKVRKMGYECKDTYVADINYLNLDGRVFVIYLNGVVRRFHAILHLSYTNREQNG